VSIVGKKEIWRSLGTDSPTVALKRSHQVAAAIERDFEIARSQIGQNADSMILAQPRAHAAPNLNEKVEKVASKSITLRELYDAYMSDPTRDWSPTTRTAYETTRRMVLAILGAETPIRSITRAQCREMIDVLRWLPRNSSKL